MMNKDFLIQALEKDIENLESQIELLYDYNLQLSQKLGGLKKTFSLLSESLIHEQDNYSIPQELPEKWSSLKDIEAKTSEQKNDMAREIEKKSVPIIQLKNGQVNVPYEDFVNLAEYNIPQNADIQFEGIEQIRWNKEESKFEGELLEPGEFEGKFIYWESEDDKSSGKPGLEKGVHILINADPQSLWRNVDPPVDAEFYKENTDFKYELFGHRVLMGASVRGKSHANKGTFRDDHFEIGVLNDGWALQVVSDGAGSAVYSREGSKIACRSVMERVSDYINDEGKRVRLEKLIFELNENKPQEEGVTGINERKVSANPGNTSSPTTLEGAEDNRNIQGRQNDDSRERIGEVIHELTVTSAHFAFQEINKLAEQKGVSIKKFSSTILFALSKEFDFGTVIISFAIGDGAIGVVTKKEGVLLMVPDGGDFSGQTRFVTMRELFQNKDIYSRSQLRLFSDKVEAIMLMTDGISDPIFGTDNNLKDSGRWMRLWRKLQPVLKKKKPDEKEVLQWMDFYEKGEYDDRTLTILF
jgi:hypothetical protein